MKAITRDQYLTICETTAGKITIKSVCIAASARWLSEPLRSWPVVRGSMSIASRGR